MNRGTLVPFNKKSYKTNPYSYFEINKNINVIFCVPSLLLLLEKTKKINSAGLSSIHHLLLTGEPIPQGLPKNWYKNHKNSNLYNLYGTTETAIISHWFKVPKDINENYEVPVGKKLSNIKVLLVDDNRVVKKGEVGESYVYGPQISSGYWNNEFLTKKQFINFKLNKYQNQVVYKTGDLLKLAKNNLYYHVGRVDTQIKISGYRVELGEIENCIKELEDVHDAVVLLGNTQKLSRKIYAFIIDSQSNLTEENLTKYLKKRLPNYMLPKKSYFFKKDFPRNENGKIDKKNLLNLINQK